MKGGRVGRQRGRTAGTCALQGRKAIESKGDLGGKDDLCCCSNETRPEKVKVCQPRRRRILAADPLCRHLGNRCDYSPTRSLPA